MIDLATETLVPIPEAPKLLPPKRSGKLLHASAIYRWTSKGLRGHILESVQVGNVRYTSLPALHRFFSNLARSPQPAVTAPPGRQPRRSNDADEKELIAAGG